MITLDTETTVEDLSESDMEGRIIYAPCKGCSPDEEVPQEVVRATVHRKGPDEKGVPRFVANVLARCESCGTVNPVRLVFYAPKKVKVTISRYEESECKEVEMDPLEEIEIGDVIEVEGERVKITNISTHEEDRVEKAKVKDIVSIWGVSLDVPARIGVSINLPSGYTISEKVEVDRDEEFAVGEIYELDGVLFRVHAIKPKGRPTIKREGESVKAEEIKRIYGRPVRRGTPKKSLESI
ncbi:HVO_0476 family zinc finger protein [Methanopyrus sp.]